MYFVWQSSVMFMQGEALRAELRPFRNDWFRINTLSCDPIRHLFPDHLEFDVNIADDQLPDYLFSGNFDSCSPRLADLVRETGVEIETVPVWLWNKATGSILRKDYSYVHVMKCISAVDFERTEAEVRTSKQGRPFLRSIKRLVLRTDFLQRRIQVCRLAEAPRLVLVSQEFKSSYEQRGLWGSDFKPVDEYTVP